MISPIQPLDKVTLLVVDDTQDIRDLLEAALSRRGFHVLTADGAAQMDAILHNRRIDLIILDSMMPGEDGLSICKRLTQAKGPPIIMLSARGQDVDRLEGLELGAQDYVAKPFNADELAARIRIVLGRQAVFGAVSASGTTLHFFGWALDNVSRRLTSPSGHELILSEAEFALMSVFLRYPDRALQREQLVAKMSELHESTTEQAIDTLISRLRRKLKNAYPDGDECEELIRTVYGKGYMFRPESGIIK
ncbi:response regulator [Asticcacaulis sp. 201]|uniref:response regulator n=1 Tax=Asticcacaulis sp. 201 TaxID=3028787 RepID=UPI002915E5AF|nr:response regulator [Asticcacaulis sp. 201]MDV6330940.1 response regulator [Asticcacaulis sp. 201]